MEWNGLKESPTRSVAALIEVGPCINGTHNGEMRRLGIRDRETNDRHDSRRKDKLITSRRVLINIYKGEYEVRGKFNSKVLDERQQKASTRLSNRIILR